MSTTKPYPFQAKGIRLMYKKFGMRVLLADEMGLGKTFQTLRCIRDHLEEGPVTIICPATIKENWRREAVRHADMVADIISGRKAPPIKGVKGDPNKVYIINFDILGNPLKKRGTWVKFLKALKPKLIVVDECHAVKSPKAQRTKAVQFLCAGVPHVIMLSGTPMTNRPAELFSILNILRPDVFPNWWRFAWRYCAPKRTPFGLDTTGASRLKELHLLMKETVMIRRLKKDVLKDLPPKVRTIIPIEVEDRKQYDEAVKNFALWLSKYGGVKGFKAQAAKVVKRGHLIRLIGRLKVKAVIEWVTNFLEDSGSKLILFGVHKVVLEPIAKHFGRRAVLVNGDVTGEDRQAAIDRFNNDPTCDLFVGNDQAAGLGWSCTSTSYVAFCEISEVPSRMSQAEDRAYGMFRGQEGHGLNSYYLMARNSIEEDLAKMTQVKQRNIDKTLDGARVEGSINLHEELDKLVLRELEQGGRNEKGKRPGVDSGMAQ